MITPQDAIPAWAESLAPFVFGFLNFLSGAYESALLSASRSRINKAIETRRLPAKSFLARAAQNDPSIMMRTELLSIFSTALVMACGLWTLAKGGEPVAFAPFCKAALMYAVVLFLIRMAANPVGDYFAERLVIGAALPMAALTAPFIPLANAPACRSLSAPGNRAAAPESGAATAGSR